MNILSKTFAWSVAALLAITAHAQENVRRIYSAPTDSLKPVMTLSECVSFAQEHSPQRLPLEARLEVLELEKRLATEAFLPNLNTSVGENVSFGRSQGLDGVYRDISNANTAFQIGASVDIWDGGAKWWSLQKSKAALQSKDYIVAEIEDNIALQTTEAYVNLLLAKEMVRVAEENLRLSEQQLKETAIQVEAGRLAVGMKIQIEAQVGQDKLALAEAKVDAKRAERLLLLNMGVVDQTVSLDVPDLKSEEVESKLSENNPHILKEGWQLPASQLAKMEADRAEYDIRRAKAGYWPKLSLSGGYSNGYYYNFGKDVDTSMNVPFGEQWKHNGRSFLGVSLSIPIYNNGQVRGQIQQAELQAAQLLNTYIQKTYQDEQNIILAQTDLQKAEEQTTISNENRKLTKQALDIAELEYRAGRITAYEWEQAKTKFVQAEATYVRAIFNRLLRHINLTYYNSGTLPTHLAE